MSRLIFSTQNFIVRSIDISPNKDYTCKSPHSDFSTFTGYGKDKVFNMEQNHTNERLSIYNNIFKKNENIYRKFARTLGLSECSLWILYILRTEFAAPVQSEICTCLHQPKQSVNSALKKLESDGYIELAAGNDHRSKQVSLTESGIRFCEKTVDRVIEIECQALDSLSVEEQNLFFSLFQKYTDLLEKYAGNILQE